MATQSFHETKNFSCGEAGALILNDPAYFDRDGLYGDKNGEYPDNAERYSEFCRAAIELAKQIWMPDIIHCHDWQTAMIPVLLRSSYADTKQRRSLM